MNYFLSPPPQLLYFENCEDLFVGDVRLPPTLLPSDLFYVSRSTLDFEKTASPLLVGLVPLLKFNNPIFVDVAALFH